MKTNYLKQFTVLAVAGLMFSSVVMAQPYQGNRGGRGGPPSAEDKLAFMNEQLDLSDTQSVSMLEVLQASEAERTALRQQSNEFMKPEICALMSSTHEEILSILSVEQAEAFDQMVEDRRGRRRGGFGMGPPDCSEFETASSN